MKRKAMNEKCTLPLLADCHHLPFLLLVLSLQPNFRPPLQAFSLSFFGTPPSFYCLSVATHNFSSSSFFTPCRPYNHKQAGRRTDAWMKSHFMNETNPKRSIVVVVVVVAVMVHVNVMCLLLGKRTPTPIFNPTVGFSSRALDNRTGGRRRRRRSVCSRIVVTHPYHHHTPMQCVMHYTATAENLRTFRCKRCRG